MEAATLVSVVGAILGLALVAWCVLIVVSQRSQAKAKASAGAGAADPQVAPPEVPLEARMGDTQQMAEGIVPEARRASSGSAPLEPQPFLPQDAHGYHWDAPGETSQDTTAARNAEKMQVDKTGVNDDQKCWSCACSAQGQPAA